MFAVLALIAFGAAAISANYAYTFQRLQGNGQIQEDADWATYRLRAVCDTGNGTMVYTASSRVGIAVSIQPGGCGKIVVVAEKP